MKRDKTVIEGVDYLDKVMESTAERNKGASYQQLMGMAYSSLRSEIKEWIQKQILRCHNDPRWLFGNYFWIQHPRSGEPTTLDMFDAQELILETIEYLWAHKRPGWVLVHKARQMGVCFQPDTKILTSDLRWVRIDSLKPGEELVGLDEYPPGPRRSRRMVPSIVEDVRDVFEPAIELSMDNGEMLTATPEHRLLCKVRGAVHTEWRETRTIRIGDQIRYVTKPWGGSDYEDGWFGGMIDGESSVRPKKRAGAEMRLSQVFGPVYDRGKSYLESRGYSCRFEVDKREPGKKSKLGKLPVGKLVVGKMDELFRLIGQTRPTRFINKKWWEGKELPKGRGVGPTWCKVVSIKLLPRQRMIDLQTSTKTFIANGFVSHNSTFAVAMLVWRVCFHSQVLALILAQDEGQATYELSIFQWFMNNMPWWLRPNVARQHIESRMVMGIQDEGGYGGLNSMVIGASIKKMSAFAQGKPFSDRHITEVGSFPDKVARKIIDEDLSQMVSRPGCVGIDESKPYGASGYWYKRWHHYEKQGKDALRMALFLPAFMEKSRTCVVPTGFKPNKEEQKIRERYFLEWKHCPTCGTMYYAVSSSGSSTAQCHRCGSTGGAGVMLTDGQLGWYRMRKSEVMEGDDESEQSFLQENAITAEEGFQVHGKLVFPKDVYRYVQSTVRDPVWVGEWRSDFTFHCKVAPSDALHVCHSNECRASHLCCNPDCRRQNISHNNDEMNLKVWEMPIRDARYYVGCDAAYGEEEGDYGVITIHKCGSGWTTPDEQVAEWRVRGDAGTLGKMAFILASVYNRAQVAVEVKNGPGEKAQLKLKMMGYDNLYRWKHYDSVKMLSQKEGWVTNQRTKPMLITTFIEWCRQKIIVIRSKDFLFEIPSFIKRADYDESGAAANGKHDDAILANLLCLHCHHDEDYDPERGRIVIPRERLQLPDPSIPGSGLYVMTCVRGHVSTAENPRGWICPECKAENDNARVPALSATRARGRTAQLTIDLDAQPPRTERVFVGQAEQVEIV